jgi:hypothetical protein
MATFTNYCHNPSVETNDSGWAQIGTGSTRVRRTTDAVSGSACMEFGVSGTAADQGFEFAGLVGLNLPAGTEVYLSAYLKSVSGGTDFAMVPRFLYTDASNVFGTYTDITLTGAWARNTVSMTVPSGKTLNRINFRVVTKTGFAGGASAFRVDAVMFTVGPPPAYFDGDSPGAAWTGTAHASFSTLTVSAARPATVLTIGSSHVGPLRVGKD